MANSKANDRGYTESAARPEGWFGGTVGKLDPEHSVSDEDYIRGGLNDADPKRIELMKKYNLKEDPKYPGVYGSRHRNFK